MEARDVTLLTIGAARGQSLSPVQLQKALFLVSRADLIGMPKPLYDFQPYHYGPFDLAVYVDAGRLEAEGLVVRTTVPGQTWLAYCVTAEGADKAQTLMKALPKKSSDYVDAVVRWVQPLSFGALVRAIYAAYPDFKKNSVFQE